MSFYAILPSNACPKTQPDNNASNYIIDFESPLQFEGHWEVALTEYTFNQFNMLSDEAAAVLYTRDNHFFKEYYLSIGNGDEFKVIHTPKIDYWTYGDDLFEFIYKKQYNVIYIKCLRDDPYTIVFNSLKNAKAFGFTTLVLEDRTWTVSSTIKFWPGIMDYLTVRIYWPNPFFTERKILTQYPLFRTTEQLIEYFKTNLQGILTNIAINDKKIFSFELAPAITMVQFDDDLAYKLGFEKNKNKFQLERTFDSNTGVPSYKGQVFKGTKKVKLMKAFEQLLVYTSVSDPIIVGDVKVPLLGTVWVDTRNGEDEIIHDTMDHPMYIPISSKSINNVEVQIRNDGGKLIQFPYGSKSNLILHFRKHE